MSDSKYTSILSAGFIFLLCGALTACQSETSDQVNYDCSSAETLEVKKKNSQPWSKSQLGKNSKAMIDFSCKSSPFVGDFQECEILLKYEKQPRFADAISIDGGMKAHGHGLPTVPTLAPTAKAGHYRLEGLKYSMPGAWTIGFKVNVDGVTDQVIFDFTI